MAITVIVHVDGKIMQHPDGSPAYNGGRAVVISIERGITLRDMQELIHNVAGTPSHVMRMTYGFPHIRYPNSAYHHVGIELVDDTGVDMLFQLQSEIPGYSPILYTETSSSTTNLYDHQGCQAFEQGSFRHHGYDDNQTYFGMHATSSQQHYDHTVAVSLGDDIPGHHGYDDNVQHGTSPVEHEDGSVHGSETSLEDVDNELDAEEIGADETDDGIPVHHPPCPLYTQDTWSHMVDPSPPMPNRSHVGWDGVSDFFQGQVSLHSHIIR